jgi:hypothetical protein
MVNILTLSTYFNAFRQRKRGVQHVRSRRNTLKYVEIALKDVEICIHVWFGPSPNDTVRATPSAQTATCAPDCTLRGPVQGFRPAQCRARRQLFGARAAPRPNGTVRAGPHAARSRARLPDRTARAGRCSVPCAPARCSVFLHAARARNVLLGAGTVGRQCAAA